MYRLPVFLLGLLHTVAFGGEYLNDFSVSAADWEILQAADAFDTAKSSWSLDTTSGLFNGGTTSNSSNENAVIRQRFPELGGDPASASAFEFTVDLSVTPHNGSDQICVWVLADDVTASEKKGYRCKVEPNGSFTIEQITTSFSTIAAGNLGSALPTDGTKTSLTLTVSVSYIDTDDDDIADAPHLTFTVTVAGQEPQSIDVQPSTLFTGSEFAIQLRNRSSSNDLSCEIDRIQWISNGISAKGSAVILLFDSQ